MTNSNDEDVYDATARALTDEGPRHVLVIATYIPAARDAFERIRARLPRAAVDRRTKTAHMSKLTLANGSSLVATNTPSARGGDADILIIVGDVIDRDRTVVDGLEQAVRTVLRVRGY